MFAFVRYSIGSGFVTITIIMTMPMTLMEIRRMYNGSKNIK